METAVTAWLEGKDGITEPICFVGGGPGSGKSTFARRLATRRSEENQRVLFIELQDFDMEEKIESAIGTYYCRGGAFVENPVGQVQFASVDRPLLLIFDGLDELSEPSDYADRETANFVSRLDRALRSWNSPWRRVLALITGRPPVIQEHTSGVNLNDRQRLWVLPYVIEKEERHGLVGSAAQLRHDQRNTWWEGYARAKGLDRRSVPDALLNPEISELTAEPLLCYLVVLSGFHERAGAGENRNLIYRALYESVVERRHAGGAKLAAAKAITDTVLDRLMEAIAVAAWWHTEGRIASVEQIRAACGDDQELHEALDPFPETGHRPARLFAAFYFRAAEGRRHGGNAFEFTHKSFSEYLTARRLVREITEIHDDLTHSRRYSHENALEEWTRLTAPAPMTMDLLRFLRDEVALHLELRKREGAPETTERALAELESWRETLTALFNRQLREGLPLKSLAGDHLRSVERQARNAEEALLAAMNACAQVTKRPVAVEWPHGNSAGAMLHRLRGQRNLHQPIVALACLGRLPLVEQLLLSQELGGADLSNSDLTDSWLSSSDLSDADLNGATLIDAEIILAYVPEADFSGADLSGAILGLTFGSRAKFKASILQGAKLNDAEFSEATSARPTPAAQTFAGPTLPARSSPGPTSERPT